MTRKLLRNLVLPFVVPGLIVGCANLSGTTSENESPLAQNRVEAPSMPAPPPVVNYRHASLTDLSLNNMGNQIVIKPGSIIQGSLSYVYNCPNCNQNLNNQIIIGLARRSAQACIYDGGSQGQGSANFQLKVPAKPGKYDVRFRVLQATDCSAALKAGWGDDNSPSRETTLGIIIASKKRRR